MGPDARNDHVKAAGLRGLLAYQWAHPGEQLLFMAKEFAQCAEWSEERGIDWYQLDENSFSSGIQRMVHDINGIYRRHVFNFSGSEHSRHRLGLPHAGLWREVLNTDADIYNGTGIGNYGAVEATDELWHGRPASTVMVLPPLAALWLEPS